MRSTFAKEMRTNLDTKQDRPFIASMPRQGGAKITLLNTLTRRKNPLKVRLTLKKGKGFV